MSKFSGKCDLADTCDIFGIDKIISKYKIYTYGNILPLKIEKPSDLIPYYPYTITMMVSTKEDGGAIHLSKESFVDEEEREHLGWDLSHIKKYWRKCKRDKKEFDEKEALDMICFLFSPRDYQREIIRRVKDKGNKATIDGIHAPSWDHYRRELYDKMVENGWDKNRSYEWCFGWERYYEKIRKEQQEKSNQEEKTTDKKPEAD